jgi:cytochrome c peroxidase
LINNSIKLNLFLLLNIKIFQNNNFFARFFCVLAFFNFSFLIGCSDKSPWAENEITVLKSFQINNLDQKKLAKSNKFAFNKEAINFGRQLFFDERLSANGKMSCATCHDPKLAFTDGLSKAQGIHRTGRNTQTILGVAYYNWFYWDGRKDSLWSQALIPFEAPDEMGSNRLEVLRIIGRDVDYRKQYESLFGAFPDLIFNSAVPKNAGQFGDAETRNNWYKIPLPTQKIINRAYVNLGKSIAAFERSLDVPKTRFDYYLDGLFNKDFPKENQVVLSDDEFAGIKLFIDPNKTHCLRCHSGPLFTNNDFHNIETGNFTGPELDFGRVFGIQAVMQDEFNCLGEYSDASSEDCTAVRFLPRQIHDEMQGAFKTPSLRYMNKTKPFFHDGRFSELQQVLNHYISARATSELPELVLSDLEQKQLIAFLKMLDLQDN